MTSQQSLSTTPSTISSRTISSGSSIGQTPYAGEEGGPTPTDCVIEPRTLNDPLGIERLVDALTEVSSARVSSAVISNSQAELSDSARPPPTQLEKSESDADDNVQIRYYKGESGGIQIGTNLLPKTWKFLPTDGGAVIEIDDVKGVLLSGGCTAESGFRSMLKKYDLALVWCNNSSTRSKDRLTCSKEGCLGKKLLPWSKDGDVDFGRVVHISQRYLYQSAEED